MMPAIADEQPDGQAALAVSGNGQPQGEGGHRRRRRRGRRGGRNRDQDNQNPGPVAPEADRFGAPEEIDTTPNVDRAHAPGMPSAPVWSLHDDIPDTTPVADTAPNDEAGKPVKKGWWQRAFSGGK
jgi:ribonuclease E